MMAGVRAPIQVLGAAGLIAVVAVVALALSLTAIGAFAFLIAILLAWLLVTGSRAAWIIVIASGVVDLVFSLAGEHSLWGIIVDGVVLTGLSVPSSIRFVWGERTRKSPIERKPAANELEATAIIRSNPLDGWWQGRKRQTSRYRLLAWRLLVASLLLLGPVGLTYGWAQDSRHDRVLVVLANLIWICWALITFACLVAAALAVWERWAGTSSPPDSC